MAIHAQRFLSSRTRWIVFSIVVALGVYLLAVTPVRTYFDQRSQMQAAEARYELLAKANEQLDQRARELQSDEAIEQLARQRYELVPPGTEAYAVMPPPVTVAPQSADDEEDDGLWSDVLDNLSFWN